MRVGKAWGEEAEGRTRVEVFCFCRSVLRESFNPTWFIWLETDSSRS